MSGTIAIVGALGEPEQASPDPRIPFDRLDDVQHANATGRPHQPIAAAVSALGVDQPGFAEGVKGKFKLTTAAFASAVQRAKNASFEALSEPREGTILTVISDWANYIEAAAHKTEDFVELLKK